MLIHLYIGLALVYGWMASLLLLHKGPLGHLIHKIIKKCVFRICLKKIHFHVRISKLVRSVFKRMLMALKHKTYKIEEFL